MNIITKQYNNAIINFDLSNDLMINLTEMAKANGKLVADFLRLKSTEDYLKEYSADMVIPITDILVVKQGGTHQGTWANQDIALYFAQWLSPKFHIWCNKQIKDLLTNGKVSMQPKTALELAKEQVALLEALEAKQIELDHAIKTKAYISDKKTATALNTASQAVKKVNKLEIELDKSKEYCTIKRMEMINHGQKFNWRLLKSTASEMDIDTIDVFDQNYGKVKAYHKDVWLEAYGLTF